MTVDSTYFLCIFVASIAFLVVGAFLGGFLAGLDRVISAKLQGRVGPPVLQPFYDVIKLINKENASINTSERVYMMLALIFVVLAGGLFFSGNSLILCIFIVTLSSLMIIVAAYSSASPFAEAGGAREILQVLSYEPMVIMFAVLIFMACGKVGIEQFSLMNVLDLFRLENPSIVYCIPAFIGLVYVLTIKLRKSPFDISSAAHAHQEIVSGITTEMSGRTLAIFEIIHWLETVLFLGWVATFFICSNPMFIPITIIAVVVIWFFEILIDNNFARMKWQFMLKSAWAVTFICCFINIVLINFI